MEDRSESYKKGYIDGYASAYAKAKTLASAAVKKFKKTAEIHMVYPFNVVEKCINPGETVCDYSENAIRKAMSEYLTDRERCVLERLYKNDETLEEIGKDFSVTHERVRQIEHKALTKIRIHRTAMKAVTMEDFLLLSAKYKALCEEKNHTTEDVCGNRHIGELNVPIRIYNSLKRAGYETIGSVANLTFDELVKIRNIGPKAACEICIQLAKFGYKIDGGPDLFRVCSTEELSKLTASETIGQEETE